MKFYQKWQGVRICNGKPCETFDATVPGNIQNDYARHSNWGDPMYGENCTKFTELENDAWEYRTRLAYTKGAEETVWFVSGGIDYRYDIFLNGSCIYTYEGMFKPVELELTERLLGNDELCVHIYPHPKRDGAWKGSRDEADASCKPPVCYGWDWNPRLLISGMWQEAYIETRNEAYIGFCEPRYRLDQDFSKATVWFDIDCKVPCTVKLYDREENLLYCGDGSSFELDTPKLWWCNGQGEAYLYKWTVENTSCTKSGSLGFRQVKLLRNVDAHDPSGFPKSRYAAPITLELNGRRIFMKGSNFVNPDIFWGKITDRDYETLLDLAKDANMNILRLWGGASFCKPAFYELCDQKGMMVWQEFMLACNAYPNDERYLSVLEGEATAMIKALRHHASLVMWCGGNELFNGWSGMSDQSLPLRLLGSLCYRLDREKPYLMTSPLEGMGHGGYMFYDKKYPWGDVFRCFQAAKHTAYTEFGVPSISAMEALEQIIPAEELGAITETPSWKLHHAMRAWRPQSHACVESLEMYFGKDASVAERIEQSDWLQVEGMKAIYEEARRQWPHCSAALNWCFNEPWITAANCSVVRYPAIPKPGYYAVRDALRSKLFSARIPKFDWKSGERFTAQIWLLNDSRETCSASVEVLLRIGALEIPLLVWDHASEETNCNLEGASVCCVLPEEDTGEMTLVLKSSHSDMSSQYKLLYERQRRIPQPKGMNM